MRYHIQCTTIKEIPLLSCCCRLHKCKNVAHSIFKLEKNDDTFDYIVVKKHHVAALR